MVSHPLRSVSIVYVPDNGRTLPHRCIIDCDSVRGIRSIELDTRRSGSCVHSVGIRVKLLSNITRACNRPRARKVEARPRLDPPNIADAPFAHLNILPRQPTEGGVAHTSGSTLKKGMDDANCTRYSGCDAGWGSDSAWSAFACSCVSPCPCAWLWPCRASACCCACS